MLKSPLLVEMIELVSEFHFRLFETFGAQLNQAKLLVQFFHMKMETRSSRLRLFLLLIGPVETEQ